MGVSIEVMADCASNYGVFKVPGSRSGIWTVTFNGSEGPAFCTCPAFEFSRGPDKTCKHISRVWESACMYNPQWRDGKAEPLMKPERYTYGPADCDERCPACGGPVVFVRRAV